MVTSNPLARIKTLSELVYHMFRDDSHYTIILGKNKSGKTTTAFNIMEKANRDPRLKFKWFGSNVKGVRECPFQSEYVTDLESLEEQVDYADGKCLFFFDEMGKSLGKRKFMARLNVEFLEKLQVIRKSKLSLIGCAIGDSVDREILKPYYLNSWIDKGSRYTKEKMTYYDIDLEAVRKFECLKQCQTRFSEYSVASFLLKRIIKSSEFDEEKKQRLWDWTDGVTISSMGLDPTQFRREVKEYLRQKLTEERRGHQDKLLSEANQKTASRTKAL